MSPSPMAGYWLPRAIRAELISERTEYAALSFAAGQPCAPEAPGAVTARWPRWGAQEWAALLERLAANRERVPRGAALWARLQRP